MMLLSSNNTKQEMEWKPSKSFLRKGYSQFSFQGFPSFKVEWSFVRINSSMSPYSNYLCKMKTEKGLSFGSGEGLFPKKAIMISFAEAWERIWLELYPNFKESEIKNIYSSNGFASGQTNLMALSKSKEELIERLLLMEAWQTMRFWQQYSLVSLKATLLKSYYESLGWEISLFKIQASNGGYVLAALGVNQIKGARFDTVYISDKGILKEREEKLIRSLSRSFLDKEKKVSNFKLPYEAKPEDHFMFYSQTINLKAFEFLKEKMGRENYQILEPQKIISELIVPVTEFPAVAVSSHPLWPQISWGRQSIKGKNKWPHPLA